MRLPVRETLSKTLLGVAIAADAGAFNGAPVDAPRRAAIGAKVGEPPPGAPAVRPHTDPALPRRTMRVQVGEQVRTRVAGRPLPPVGTPGPGALRVITSLGAAQAACVTPGGRSEGPP